jgi:phosphopantothenoylcysteine decarboxylase/phosphopantothenate--cysteine ligase
VAGGHRVLLGVTGGIAAYKSALLARELTSGGHEVTCVLTEAATRFVGPDTFAGLTGRPAHTSLWERPGEVLHVRLARETEVAVVAPATADTIAKLAHGLAGDLLTSVLLEYTGPLVIAPAMHDGMWHHPATRANVDVLRSRGAVLVGPVHGALAHGDEGWGRMSEPTEIAAAVTSAARGVRGGAASGPLAGRHVLVTAGPTHEPIDPVRFVGNRSSGKMGAALAAEARDRGARVTVVLGPGTIGPPPGVDVVPVVTAEDMLREVTQRAPGADVIIMAAAVADFRPATAAAAKLKKDRGVPPLELEATPDILAALGRGRRPGQVLVGFAAETDDVAAAGRAKLTAKGVDIVVANEVGRDGTGFGSDDNTATIVTAGAGDEPLRSWTKVELATAVLDRVEALLVAPGS